MNIVTPERKNPHQMTIIMEKVRDGIINWITATK
jgi:hypothetical protein